MSTRPIPHAFSAAELPEDNNAVRRRLLDGLADAAKGCKPSGTAHPLWDEPTPPSLPIETVEDIWSSIAARDDWTGLADAIVGIRRLGEALGTPPRLPNRAACG